MLRALIWDVDGTVAETERDGHRMAFNLALQEHGLPWQWDVPTYGRLLQVTGGFERLLHDMADRPGAPVSVCERRQLARAVHQRKNQRYAELIATGGITARPGVARLMGECGEAGVTMAIATTTSRENVDALFTALFPASYGSHWPERFAAIVCAKDAPAKKPDPLAYRLALDRLGIEAHQAIALEDSPNGLAAATALGIAAVVTRSVYFAGAAFPGCAAICDDLDSPLAWPGGDAPRTDLDVLRRVLASRR